MVAANNWWLRSTNQNNTTNFVNVNNNGNVNNNNANNERGVVPFFSDFLNLDISSISENNTLVGSIGVNQVRFRKGACYPFLQRKNSGDRVGCIISNDQHKTGCQHQFMKSDITFNEVFSDKHLYVSYKKCLEGVGWKGTVQNYKHHAFTNIVRSGDQLQKEIFRTGNFFKFPRMERGKLRHIQSVGISERVIQRCLCDYLLTPTLTKKFIYDNSACIKDKGVHFAIRRLKVFLTNYYKTYHTNTGYILQYDFHHYFETIPHETLIDKVNKTFNDERLKRIYAKLINDFDGNVGIGLGSQVSQISALFYPNCIDHTFCRNKSVFAYARYMDDGYVISNDKEFLKSCKDILERLCSELQITTNESKTVINRLSQGFVFLKNHIKLMNNGAVVVKTNRANLDKNKRKLRKYREKLDDGNMTWDEIKNIYKGTFCGLKKFHSYSIRRSYKNYFFKLFAKELANDPERIILLKKHKYS